MGRGEPHRALLDVAHEDAGLVVAHSFETPHRAKDDLTCVVDRRSETHGERCRDDSARVADRPVDDRRRRELRVRNEDAARVVGDQRRVDEADLLDEAGLIGDRDSVADLNDRAFRVVVDCVSSDRPRIALTTISMTAPMTSPTMKICQVTKPAGAR